MDQSAKGVVPDDWLARVGQFLRGPRRHIPQPLMRALGEVVHVGKGDDGLSEGLFIQPDGLTDDAILECRPKTLYETIAPGTFRRRPADGEFRLA